MATKLELLRAAQIEVDRNLTEYLDAWEEALSLFILDSFGEVDESGEGESDGTGTE